MHQQSRYRHLIEALEQRALLANITGIVFDDLNGNGRRDAGEPPLADMQLYLDVNLNGDRDKNEPRTTSAADGSYIFTDLETGTYRVRHEVPAGRRLSSPEAIFYDVDVAKQTDQDYANKDFGNTNTAVIRGTVFRDLNGDTLKQSDEPGLAGWTVFIDKNNNGKHDANEKVRITNSRGEYRFAGLTPGTYRVRIEQQNKFERTNPLSGVWVVKDLSFAQSFSNRNFGQRLHESERP